VKLKKKKKQHETLRKKEDKKQSQWKVTKEIGTREGSFWDMKDHIFSFARVSSEKQWRKERENQLKDNKIRSQSNMNAERNTLFLINDNKIKE
jgi:hypothetical protein